jgi:hypothetical protein
MQLTNQIRTAPAFEIDLQARTLAVPNFCTAQLPTGTRPTLLVGQQTKNCLGRTAGLVRASVSPKTRAAGPSIDSGSRRCQRVY